MVISKETAIKFANSKGYMVTDEITLDNGTRELMVGNVRVYYHSSFGGRGSWRLTGDDRTGRVGEMIYQAVNNQELARAQRAQMAQEANEHFEADVAEIVADEAAAAEELKKEQAQRWAEINREEGKQLAKLRRAEKLKAKRAGRLTDFHQLLIEALDRLGDGTSAMAVAVFLNESVFKVSGGLSSLVEKDVIRSEKDSKGKAHYLINR